VRVRELTDVDAVEVASVRVDKLMSSLAGVRVSVLTGLTLVLLFLFPDVAESVCNISLSICHVDP